VTQPSGWEFSEPKAEPQRRREQRRPAWGSAISARVGKREVELMDVSASGLGLLVPLDGTDDALLRARTLDLELRQDQLPIARVKLRVTHATPADGMLRAGGVLEHVEVLPTGNPPLPEAGDVIDVRDDDLKRKVVNRAVEKARTAALDLPSGEQLLGALSGVEGNDAVVSFCARVGTLPPLGAEAVSLVVTLHRSEFLLEGAAERVSDTECHIRVDRVLSMSRRDCERVRLPSGSARLEWDDPLTPDRRLGADVVDITPKGVAVRFERGATELFPAPPLTLTLRTSDLSLRLVGEVQNTRTVGDARIVGLKIAPVHARDVNRLTALCRSRRFPALRERKSVTSGAVLELMRASGYMDLREGGPGHPTDAWKNGPGDDALAENVVYQTENGALLGHMSCLRVYETTFLLQELATVGLRRGKIAYPLYMQHMEWIAGLTEHRGFVLAYFDQSKSWHQSLFGDFVRWAGSEALSIITELERLEARAPIARESGDAAVVRPPRPDELAFVARLSRSQLPALYADAIALDDGAVARPSLCSEYERLGLQRGRSAFVVELDGRAAGAAICDTGPRELSLFNLLNFAHVFFREGMAPARARDAQSALLTSVRSFYAERGVADPLIVVPKGGARFGSEAGLEIAETMGAWTASLGGLKQWRNFMHFAVGGVGEPRRRRSLE
jgi:hypothetical protein